jgi:large subunit ribosomal protein L23
MNIYEVLRRPIETEKSRYQAAKLHQYAFQVATQATKPQLKEAIETIFDVEVQAVRVVTPPSKRSRRGRSRRIVMRRTSFKKAIVTIRADQSIDEFFGGVK